MPLQPFLLGTKAAQRERAKAQDVWALKKTSRCFKVRRIVEIQPVVLPVAGTVFLIHEVCGAALMRAIVELRVAGNGLRRDAEFRSCLKLRIHAADAVRADNARIGAA